MAINFTDSPSNGATQTINGRTYTYNSSKNKWDTTATEVTGPTATVYASVDNLPTTGNTTGNQAFVSGTNRLYIWNGSGWYNIALLNNSPTISGANAAYTLANDGTATTVTLVATDPEGLPITYSLASDTSGNIATVTQGTGSNTNVFTITPSTNTAHVGTFSLTFRASDGVNLATAVSSFTLQFKIDNSHYTTGLFTSVGANNAVNTAFDDKSTLNHTITVAGDAHQTTFSPYRHGGYSVYFDGSGDYLASDNNNISNFGTGDFTLEGWFWVPDRSALYTVVDGRDSLTAADGWSVAINTSGGIYVYTGGFHISGTNGDVTTQTWHHWALTRSSGDMKLFLNGTQQGSTNSTARNFTVNKFRVGASGQGAEHFKGYQRDVRVVKGTALYTSNFTKPDEPLTAVANTTFLGCHLPYFKDGSTNDHTITINGDPSIEPFVPFDHSEYSTAEHLGSAHFDGTGDVIKVADHADLDGFSGDFTLEFWFYPTASGDWKTLINKGTNSTTAPYIIYQRNQNLALYLSSNGSSFDIAGGTVISTGGIKYNTWHHYALARNGNSYRSFLNGKLINTITSSSSPHANAQNIGIGAANNATEPFAGNIADVRIVNGTAVYTADFTPPTAPLTAVTNTKLLVQSTDAAIIDKAQSARSVKLIGNTKSSTTQTKFLTSSMYFDGTGDYINAENFDIGNVGTAPFTFEGWFYLTASPSNYITIMQTRGSNASQTGFVMAISATDFYIYSGALIGAKGSAISSNQWYHWAYTRDTSGNQRVFLDGTQTGSTYTTARNYTDDKLWIGAKYDGSEYFTGYQSDIRITKGLARYTANFTPPTAALKA